MDASRSVLGAAAAAMLLLLGACGQGGGGFPAAPAAAPDPGYRGPPRPLATERGPGGSVNLTGRAQPSSKLLMASPAGEQIETTADGAGAWSAALGPVSAPTLYRLAAESDGQRVEAEGLVLVLPGAAPAALLRGGAGALVLAGGKPELSLLAVDIDSGGAAVVSGRAPASTPVRILVDGVLAVEGAAGARGRFSLTLPKPLASGTHKLQAVTPKAMAAASVAISPPQPPTDGPYKAVPQGAGWRIDWITPGGGPQTTLLLAPAA